MEAISILYYPVIEYLIFMSLCLNFHSMFHLTQLTLRSCLFLSISMLYLNTINNCNLLFYYLE